METQLYDAIIIGGGPAGYSAAIYASRAGLNTLVLEQGMPGGQIATSDMIDNYPAIPSCSGSELGQRMQDHATQVGAETAYGMVISIERSDQGVFTVQTDMNAYQSLSVIAATGATPRTAGFKGEDTYRGRGVSYCATCDAMFYRGKHVFVIGGGNSACEEAIYLSNVAESVEVILRRDQFRASRGMANRMLSHDNITVRYQTSIVSVEGDTFINSITFKNNSTGIEYEEHFEAGSIGIFVATGHNPATDLVANFVELASDGSVMVDSSMATQTPGLFCAGDMRAGSLRQVITAAADGAIAGVSAYKYVEACKETL
ncbi:NAD(P)/FAD-dependent oxidoreductase [Collinsella provencensis]|uniref:NAD(P)/FAD-dependent oxidoreductase n=1 Tax=Collinsella provencensis TaxID=1937461 RepID=UPI000C85B70E|nr:FAD-dependent oxidoreductase [Collinsella provencensis]